MQKLKLCETLTSDLKLKISVVMQPSKTSPKDYNSTARIGLPEEM